MSAHYKKGFTLLELLLVISIIGVLASIVISGFNDARARSRDARRIADLSAIRTALELYYIDYGYYPRPNSTCDWDGNCYSYSFSSTWDELAATLAPYIKLPKDPINSSEAPWGTGTNYYSYTYGNVGRYTNMSQYDLTAQLETPNHPQSCGLRDYRWYYDRRAWCTNFGGAYSNQIYEASSD